MTQQDLADWQARLGLDCRSAAAALRVSYQGYRHWLSGRRAIPNCVELLCWYVEEFGVVTR